MFETSVGVASLVDKILSILLKFVPFLKKNKTTTTKIIIEPNSLKRGEIIAKSTDIIVTISPNTFAVPKPVVQAVINGMGNGNSKVADIMRSKCLSQVRIHTKSNQVISNLILNFKDTIGVFLAQRFNNGVGEDIAIEQMKIIKIESIHIEEDITILIWHHSHRDIKNLSISHAHGRVPVVVFSHEPPPILIY